MGTSLKTVTSDLMGMSILISELSTTPPLVFSEWTSLLSSRDLALELLREEPDNPVSESSSALPRMMLSSGSSRTSVAPSSTEELMHQKASPTWFPLSGILNKAHPCATDITGRRVSPLIHSFYATL